MTQKPTRFHTSQEDEGASLSLIAAFGDVRSATINNNTVFIPIADRLIQIVAPQEARFPACGSSESSASVTFSKPAKS